MFPIHIITDKKRIETTSSKVFHVSTPTQEKTLLDEKAALRERTYSLQCGWSVYSIVCPEIQKVENQNIIKYLTIPEFLIPRRPYPVYVYIYAIVQYSSNPAMGQRNAAEATRKRFGLKTFSHTTLGRAMKRLEALTKTNEDKPERVNEIKESQLPGPRHFPSVELTGKRRAAVLSYLQEASGEDSQLIQELTQSQATPNYTHPPYIGDFIDACHHVVEFTYKKFRKLLL